MRTKFRSKTLNIDNKSNKSNEFYGEWNFYTIEIFQNSKDDFYRKRELWKEHRYYVCVTNPLGNCIVDGYEASTQSKCLQEAFDNIDIDLRDLENISNEDEEVEYWLSQMMY